MGALTGLKILDFSTLLPGPYATMVLADLGAEVLRVCAPTASKAPLKSVVLKNAGGILADEAYLGRNKKSIMLDLKQPEAVATVYRLVQEYDIVLDQFRPGVMDKLGVGYQTLREKNPAVIFCGLTGYGQDGPYRLRAGHDINYLARSGGMSVSGGRDSGPTLTNYQIGDVAAGSMNAVAGILAAVIYRQRTGEGQFVDIAMLDGLFSLLVFPGASYLGGYGQGEEEEPQAAGGLLNGGSLYGFYKTLDGRFLSVGALEPKFFETFCQGIGWPELAQEGIQPENLENVRTRVSALVAGKSLIEWQAVFKDEDACVEPVMTLPEVARDRQIAAREMLVNVPVAGQAGATVLQAANAIKLSLCPAEYEHIGCVPGTHTRQVMEGLGYTENQINELAQKGVFGDCKL